MGIQNIADRVNNISLNKPDPPAKKVVPQAPSERSVSPEKSLKQPLPQFPSIRSIYPNECLAKKWIDGQLNENTSETNLLFQIAKKNITIPNELSLNSVIKRLIENGADVNIKGLHNNTPLHLASKEGHLEMVKLLIDHGADLNTKDRQGFSPLGWAVIEEHFEIVQYLIKLGVNINDEFDLPTTDIVRFGSKGLIRLIETAIQTWK